METNELYLKTAFCCMACDGDIADEEVMLIKHYSENNELFKDIPIEETINKYIDAINDNGALFLKNFLNELRIADLSKEQEMDIVRIAIEMIEAEDIIQYSEVKFFKKIRNLLSLTDDEILAEFPDKEDYLLPDVISYDFDAFESITFNKIDFNILTSHENKKKDSD